MSDSHTPPPEKKNRRRTPVVAVAVLMAALMLSVAIVGPTTQEAEAAVPIVVIGGALAIGAIAGWLANDLMNDGKDANLEAALAANKQTLQSSLINTFKASYSFANAFAKDNAQNYEAMELLITRKAEYMARELYLDQLANGEEHIYNSNYVLSNPDLCLYLESVLKASYEQYTAAFNTMAGSPDWYVGDLAGMNNIMGYANPSAGTKTVKITQTGTDQFLTMPYLPPYLKFYAHPAMGGINGTELLLVSMGTGVKSIDLYYRNGTIAHTYTFDNSVAGQMHYVTIPDTLPDYGEYYFKSAADYAVFGYVSTSIDSSKTPKYTSYLIYNEGIDYNNCRALAFSDLNTYPERSSQGVKVSGWWVENGVGKGSLSTTVNMPDFAFCIGTSTSDSAYQYAFKIGDNDFFQFGELDATLKTIKTTANVAANSYYNLLVASGDDQRYETMPDFIFPDPAQMEGLTVQEMYALLLVYRQQMADYYQNGAYMDLDDASFSPDSIGLYVRGALYNADGTPIYNDQAIWTPFVNVASQTLTVGENVTFDNSMTVLKWGEAAAIADFLEVNGTTANMRWTYPGPGAYAIIEEMYKDGAPIDEITLSLSNYEVLVPDIPDDVPPGQSGLDNKTDTINWLVENWYWVCVGIGAVTVIAAALLRNSAVAGVGLLIILAGLAGYAATEVLPEWWESVKPWVIRQDFWRPGP